MISVLKPDKPRLATVWLEVLNYKQLHALPPEQRERKVPLNSPGGFNFGQNT